MRLSSCRQVPVKLPRQVCSRVIPVPKPAPVVHHAVHQPVVHHAVHQPVLTAPHHGLHHGDDACLLCFSFTSSTSNMHGMLDMLMVDPPCLISICAQVSTMASSTSLSSMLPLPLVPPISFYLISIIPRLHQTLSSYLISIIPQLHTTRPYFHCFTTQLQVLPIASSTLLASNTNCHQCNNL